METKILKVGFENLPKGSTKMTIRVVMRKNFRVRMWLIKQITRAYFRMMAIISKGVVDGELQP
jgi:hypothetical protein